MEKPKIVSAQLPEEKLKGVEDFVLKIRRLKEKKLDGEIEKTSEELRFIAELNKMFMMEVLGLGIPFENFLNPDAIHFLTERDFEDMFGRKGAGMHVPINKQIYINREPYKNRVELYKVLIHEAAHYFSYNKLYFEEKKMGVKELRSGYLSFNPKESNHEHFRGFNEGVTDKIAEEILFQNVSQLVKSFNLSRKEMETANSYWYDQEMNLVEIIISAIALYEGRPNKEVWQEVKKNYFLGNLGYLKVVDKIFGPGSLRVLAAARSRGAFWEPNDDEKSIKAANGMILKYFKTDDPIIRKTIANSVLSEREKKRYNAAQK